MSFFLFRVQGTCYYSYPYRCLSDSISFETIIIFVWNRCGISIVFYEAEASIDIDPRNYVTIFCTIEGGYVVITRRSDEGYFFLQRRPVVGSFKLCLWTGKERKKVRVGWFSHQYEGLAGKLTSELLQHRPVVVGGGGVEGMWKQTNKVRVTSIRKFVHLNQY